LWVKKGKSETSWAYRKPKKDQKIGKIDLFEQKGKKLIKTQVKKMEK